jgi:arabinan endo-1,5-alpha-L-arabinosidase
MSWKSSLTAFALMMVCGGAAEARGPSTYVNPVLDADFPDPTIIRAADGMYYGYATQTQRNGGWVNLQVIRSSDLVHWRYVGDAMPTKPVWASRTQDFWAPDVVRHGRRYILYFSAKPDAALSDEKQGMCFGVATGSSPAGPFTDIGHPLKCGESFVNIDPTEFDDSATGRHWLYWGSGFEPIKVQELTPDLTSFAPGSSPKPLISPNGPKGPFPVLIEGPWVIRRGGYYYLFYSGDNCCGPTANYAVMVARSRSAPGPFQTLEQATGTPHSVILSKTSRWLAPGHNSTIADRTGHDWIFYHAVDSRRARTKPTDELNTRRILLMDRIRWRNGWPVVGRPSSTPKAAPKG